jgi:rRNA maturation endonuclease Nob1
MARLVGLCPVSDADTTRLLRTYIGIANAVDAWASHRCEECGWTYDLRRKVCPFCGPDVNIEARKP